MARKKDITIRRNKAINEMWKALEEDTLPNGASKHTYQAKIHYIGEMFWLSPRTVEEITNPRTNEDGSTSIFTEEQLKAMEVDETIDPDDRETELEHYLRRATEILPGMIRLYRKAKQGQNPPTVATSELKTAQPKNSL